MPPRCVHGVSRGDGRFAGLWAAPFSECRCCGTSFPYVDSGSFGEHETATRTWWPKDQCPQCGGRYVESVIRHGGVIKGLIVGIGILSAATLAFAEPQRLDFYDANSNRQGYAVVDPQTGRVDLYDRNANRLGYGKVAPGGRVDLYSTDGQRLGSSRTPSATRRTK